MTPKFSFPKPYPKTIENIDYFQYLAVLGFVNLIAAQVSHVLG